MITNTWSSFFLSLCIFRPHRSTTYVDAAYCYRSNSDERGLSVCLSVCRSVTVVSPAQTAESIEITFGLWTRMHPRKHVLHGGAHWRNLANTIEPSMCGGDAAFVKLL